MESPDYAAGTITEYSISPRSIYGEFKGKTRYDLLSAVMICLGKPEKKENGEFVCNSNRQKNSLHGMLETLLSDRITAEAAGMSEEVFQQKCEVLKN